MFYTRFPIIQALQNIIEIKGIMILCLLENQSWLRVYLSLQYPDVTYALIFTISTMAIGKGLQSGKKRGEKEVCC